MKPHLLSVEELNRHVERMPDGKQVLAKVVCYLLVSLLASEVKSQMSQLSDAWEEGKTSRQSSVTAHRESYSILTVLYCPTTTHLLHLTEVYVRVCRQNKYSF